MVTINISNLSTTKVEASENRVRTMAFTSTIQNFYSLIIYDENGVELIKTSGRTSPAAELKKLLTSGCSDDEVKAFRERVVAIYKDTGLSSKVFYYVPGRVVVERNANRNPKSLIRPISLTIKCDECGKSNPENSKFCNNCGSDIETFIEIIDGNSNLPEKAKIFKCIKIFPVKVNFHNIPPELRQKHQTIPDRICEFRLLHEIEKFISLGIRTIKMRKDTSATVQMLNEKKLKFFFTSELIEFLEGSFTSDGVNANYSPNALFGKRLKQLSVECEGILPIAQEYYKNGATGEESFPIKDDNCHDTASAIWVIKYSDFNKAIDELKNRLKALCGICECFKQ